MLLLSEGQTGEAWKPSKKQCYLGSRGALDKVLSPSNYLAKENLYIRVYIM
jgi:hypothetical protein